MTTYSIDIFKDRFTQKEVLNLLPMMDQATLQTWVNRKQISPKESVGTGRARLYSGSDLIQILTMRLLTTMGMNLTSAVKMSRIVVDYVKEEAIGISKFKKPNIIFWADPFTGDYFFNVVDDEEDLETPPPPICSIIDIKGICDTVFNRIKELYGDDE
ncbi:MAG: MerR family transcriptional regulator [Desulfobacterales bacterium]